MLEVGTVVDGKYKILSKVGQGGMSVVYLALNERANKTWAVKEVKKDGAGDSASARRRLAAEVHILKGLKHRYLPSIVDILDDGDAYLIVMDYIEGKSLYTLLRERMSAEGLPIPVENVVAWGIQLCEALHYLHTREEPIIYRDMKPSNVMLKPDGEISLIDFGTARIFKSDHSDDTTCLGTPGYAAPEQYGGSGQSCPRSDLYCLGATLHHLVTGRDPAATPFRFPPITRCRPELLEETPRELKDTLLGLEMIIEKCTRYEKKDRYRDCAQLRYDLEHPEKLGLPYRKKQKGRLLAFFASAGMGLLMGLISLSGAFLARRAEVTGFGYYMESASTADDEDKLKLYRKAVALRPQREEAWLGVLETVGADNIFTAEEDSFILLLLSSRDNGRNQENKALFRKNKGGFVRFAYNLGMLYYYAEGEGQSKASAAGWFDIVSKADLSKLDMGEDGDKRSAWKARAEILGKISAYSGRIGQVDQAGDARISYLDYWRDLMALMDSHIAGQDNVVTELRLYNEIVYQVCTRCDAFCGAGLDRKDMEDALAAVEKAVRGLQDADQPVAEELKENITDAVRMGRKRVQAVFAANARINAGEGPLKEGGTE